MAHSQARGVGLGPRRYLRGSELAKLGLERRISQKTCKLGYKRRIEKTYTQLELAVSKKTKTQSYKDAKVKLSLMPTPGQYPYRTTAGKQKPPGNRRGRATLLA